MITEAALVASKFKLFAACTCMIALMLADAAAAPGSYEDIGLKAALIVSLVFTVRLLLKQQEEHKQERARDAEKHLESAQQREDKLLAALHQQREAMDRVANLTQEQTDYFKGVTRAIVDDRLRAGKPGEH